ncbi:MAG: hypothetical protein CMO61_10575 [Verrucomicrobiales bacterium]|nr:hypothetical protein [Verrucomicrobiales bacterium]
MGRLTSPEDSDSIHCAVPAMSNTFLFDIGNVIIAFDFGIAARRLAPHIEIPAEEALQEVTQLSIPLEVGELSTDEFIELASARIGFKGSSDFFRNSIADIFELNMPIVRFIEEQKKSGATLHLLSNTNDIHVSFFEANYPVFDLFEGRVYSHEVRLMKPDPAIFKHSIEKLKLDPGTTIYIDDKPENCEAGKEAGLIPIQYNIDKHDAFLAEVTKHL